MNVVQNVIIELHCYGFTQHEPMVLIGYRYEELDDHLRLTQITACLPLSIFMKTINRVVAAHQTDYRWMGHIKPINEGIRAIMSDHSRRHVYDLTNKIRIYLFEFRYVIFMMAQNGQHKLLVSLQTH